MEKSKSPKNWFKEDQEKASRKYDKLEGIEKQQEENKILFTKISNLGYREAIRMMDLIDDLEILLDINEKALAHLEFMEEMGEIIHKLKIKDIRSIPIVQSWIQEEREEQKEDIINILEWKFDLVSKDTREIIERIDDENIIDKLFRKSAKVKSMEEFEKILEKIKN